MSDKKDENGELLPDRERLTPFGEMLRATSLDELPELSNILIGKMSFIGPRPLLVRYYPYYTEEENRRHDVKPGITGLSQVNGRNLLNWNSRLALDVRYVDTISFITDAKIMLRTIAKVIHREGVAVRDTNPMFDLDDERRGYENRKTPN